MPSVLFVVWDGGGTVSPALGLVRELADRDHAVRVLGSRWLGPRVEAAGGRFVAFDRAPEPDPVPGLAIEDQLGSYFELWFGRAAVDDLVAELDRGPADVLVLDCMFANLMACAEERAAPAAVLAHLLYQPAVEGRWLDGWPWAVEPLNAVRRELGVEPFDATVPLWAQAWARAARVLVTSLEEFDSPAADRPGNVRYVGPLREPAVGEVDEELLHAFDGPQPVVLVSLSSSYMHQEALLGRITRAVAALDARVLVTLGHHVRSEDVGAGAGAIVRRWVPHEAILERVALVVGHGGHGTTMAALAAGVPLVCVPMGRDQHFVAERIEAVGAGRAVGADATVSELRAVVAEVLDSTDHRDAVKRLARQLAASPGAPGAADELEQLAGLP